MLLTTINYCIVSFGKFNFYFKQDKLFIQNQITSQVYGHHVTTKLLSSLLALLLF